MGTMKDLKKKKIINFFYSVRSEEFSLTRGDVSRSEKPKTKPFHEHFLKTHTFSLLRNYVKL